MQFCQQIEEADVSLRNLIEAESKIKACDGNYDILTDDDEDVAGVSEVDSTDQFMLLMSGDVNTKHVYHRDSKTAKRSESAYKCPICGLQLKNSSLLKQHRDQNPSCSLARQESSSTSNFPCYFCKEICSNEHDRDLHTSVHQNGDSYTCPKCFKNYFNLKGLKRHIRIHYNYKPYVCKDCGLAFSETASLTRHYKKHLGIENSKHLICSECGKGFSERYAYDVHVRNHQGVKPFCCDQCGKSFSDKRLLRSHARLHLSTKEFICEFCNAEFRHRSTLTVHLRTHNGSRPYICHYCSKTFKQSVHLKTHLKAHEKSQQIGTRKTQGRAKSDKNKGENQCEICNQFFSSSYLKRHIVLHDNKKSFICSQLGCDKTFSALSQLNYHVKVKHGPNPIYSCQLCRKVCASKISLVKHMKAHQRKTQI